MTAAGWQVSRGRLPADGQHAVTEPADEPSPGTVPPHDLFLSFTVISSEESIECAPSIDTVLLLVAEEVVLF